MAALELLSSDSGLTSCPVLVLFLASASAYCSLVEQACVSDFAFIRLLASFRASDFHSLVVELGVGHSLLSSFFVLMKEHRYLRVKHSHFVSQSRTWSMLLDVHLM